MATITKTPQGKWRVQVRRRGLYTSKNFILKSDAEKWARDIDRRVDRGDSVRRNGPAALKTFGDLVDQHIQDMKEVGKPLRRSKSYSLELLKEHLGRRPFHDLKRQTIIDFGRDRMKDGAGPATIAMDISYLKTILTHSAAVHGVGVSSEEVDLARVALTRLGVVGRSNERNRRPTEDELEALFEYFDNWQRLTMPMTRICQFAIASAMRQSEISSITFKGLDKRRRTVLVKDRKDPRKKDGNDQIVPLTDLTGYDAWALIEEQREDGIHPDRRIFPYNPRSVGNAFRRACKACDIEDLHFHDLRHEATSRLFEVGLTIERVALVTGHKDWKMLRRYTHLAPSMVFTPIKSSS